MGKPLRALLIEDSDDDTQLLLRELRRSGYDVEFERVETREAMQVILTEKTWDVILSDYTMPKFSALGALQVLKASRLDLPFIIISGSIGEETAVAALKAGANNFLIKGNLAKLGTLIEHELQEAQTRRERKQADQALQTSAELFGTAFHHSPVGICITTLDGRLQNISQSLSDMLGFTRAELEGKHFNDLTHPDDLEIGEDDISRMMSGKIPSISFEKRYLHKSGEPVWALVSSSLLRDSSGQPVHFITHILNMTERKRAEEQLRFYASIVESATDAIISKTIDGTIISWNPGAESLYGYRAEEVIGKPITIISPPESPHEIPTILETIRKGERIMNFETVRLTKDGQRKDVSLTISPILDNEGHILGASTIGRDITERKRAEPQLRQSEEYFSKAFSSSPTALMITRRADGKFLELNEAYTGIVGYDRTELIGHLTTEFNTFINPDQRKEIVSRLLASGALYNYEAQIQNKSGELRTVLVSLELIQFNSEDCILTTLVDITERKQAEEALRLSEQRFQLLTETIPILVWSAKADGVSDYYNAPFLQYLGKTLEEMQGWVWVDTLHPDDRERSSAVWTQAFSSGSDYEIEYRIRRAADGQYRWHLGRAVPLRDSSGTIVRWYGTCTDIHDRKLVEEALGKYATRLEAMGEIHRGILSARSSEEVAHVILRHIVRAVPSQSASVTLLDFESRQVEIFARQSKDDTSFPVGKRLSFEAFGEGMRSIESFRQGQVQIVEDIRQLPPSAAARIAQADGWQSFMNAPIRVNDELIGTLNLAADKPRAFAHEQADVILEIADILAIAFQQARLFQHIQQAREQLRVLSQRLLRVQEDERRHIARELHDEVGQALTGMRLALELSAVLPLDEKQVHVTMINDLVSRVRNISLDLRPTMLDDVGLLPTLLWHIDKFFQQTKVVVDFQHSGIDRRFAPEMEIGVFRIVQEALTNIARHADTDQVTVRMWTNAASLQMQIEDRGAGFDTRAVESSYQTSGITGMRERAIELGGNLFIDSAPGAGTQLYIELPLKAQESDLDDDPNSNR